MIGSEELGGGIKNCDSILEMARQSLQERTPDALHQIFDELVASRCGHLTCHLTVASFVEKLSPGYQTWAAYRLIARIFAHNADAQLAVARYFKAAGKNGWSGLYLARALVLDPGRADIASDLSDIGICDPVQLAFFQIRSVFLGEGVLRQKRPLSTILAYRRALRRAHDSSRRRDWAAMEEAFAEVCRLDPTNVDALVQLGHAQRERGKYVPATETYLRAAALRPHDHDVYIHLGHAYNARGLRLAAVYSHLTSDLLLSGSGAAVAELRAYGDLLSGETLSDLVHIQRFIFENPASFEPSNLDALVESGQASSSIEALVRRHLAGRLQAKVI